MNTTPFPPENYLSSIPRRVKLLVDFPLVILEWDGSMGLDRIVIKPDVCLGQPTVRGLRITVAFVLKLKNLAEESAINFFGKTVNDRLKHRQPINKRSTSIQKMPIPTTVWAMSTKLKENTN